jgi:hypothetical protein
MSFGILLALALSVFGILALFLFASHIEPETGKWVARATHDEANSAPIRAAELELEQTVADERPFSGAAAAGVPSELPGEHRDGRAASMEPADSEHRAASIEPRPAVLA